jgi:hypothetical protein
MRHFILARPGFACPVAVRSLRMFDPAATARLVTSPGSMQRPATRMGRAIGAVDVAPITVPADERLSPTVRVRTQKQPGSRQMTLVATAARVMRRPMAWTPAAVAAIMPLQSCLCTV